METERILLRYWQESDAEALFKYASDTDVGPRAGWSAHKSVEESREIIQTFFHNETTWAIVLKETGEAIGCIGYYTHETSNIPIGENDCEVGYWVGKPYWNRGICTEALKLMLDYCIHEKHFENIWADHFTGNPASGKVMEKCGFSDTGMLNRCSQLVGGDKDMVKVLKYNVYNKFENKVPMTSLQERLFAMQDKQYAAFQSKLTPGVPPESFIGIRVPALRKFAKEFAKEVEVNDFVHQLPHKYYDENMLHSLLISQVKDYEECIRLTDAFLPYVDNWAVCDIMSPKVFAKHKAALTEKIKIWSDSRQTFTCRFGIETLMSHYLGEDFKVEYLEIPASARSEEYYVKMMVAWFFATALAKQWDATIPYIEQKRLAPWTHNKTIQKAIESYRITHEQKDYLRTLKVKF